MTRPTSRKKNPTAAASSSEQDMPDEARRLDAEQLRQRDAQIALIALGYLDINTREVLGERNGGWGQESQHALEAFAREHDLAPGELDGETYRAILEAYDAALEARARAADRAGRAQREERPHE